MSHNSPINAFLAGALLLASSAAFAQITKDPAQLVVGLYPTKQAEKICLAIEKQPNMVVRLQLLAPTGEGLYWVRLPKKETKLRQIFDLNKLEDGTYTIRVKQGDEVLVKSIQLGTPTPEPTTPVRHLTVGN